MRREDFDRRLRQWAAGHGLEGPDARRAADRIADALDRPGPADDPSQGVRPISTPLRTKLLWAALGAAAAVAVVALWLGTFRGGPKQPAAVPARPEVEVSQPQIEANARLFAEMTSLFGDQLQWIGETAGEVQLGVQPVAGTPAPDSPVLWIRVLVVRRGRDQSSWQTLLTTDVLTRGEQYVELRSDADRDNRLELWGYALPDGNVAVDARLRLSTPTRLSADVSHVFAPGKPVQILALATEEGETRVFQEVNLLPTQEVSSWPAI